jgi:hypothetical protein
LGRSASSTPTATAPSTTPGSSTGSRCSPATAPRLDPDRSYYQPSGGQRVSAGSAGTDGLGPAIVLAPAAGMKPGARCGLAFADTVVDKQGERPCAGAGCAPGDTSAIEFTVEPFTLAWTEPATGATDVALVADGGEDAVITLHLNATLDPASVAGAIAITAGGATVDGTTTIMAEDDDATVVVTVTGGFHAATTYTLTIAAGLTDVYGDQLAADHTIEWTTAAEDE